MVNLRELISHTEVKQCTTKYSGPLRGSMLVGSVTNLLFCLLWIPGFFTSGNLFSEGSTIYNRALFFLSVDVWKNFFKDNPVETMSNMNNPTSLGFAISFFLLIMSGFVWILSALICLILSSYIDAHRYYKLSWTSLIPFFGAFIVLSFICFAGRKITIINKQEGVFIPVKGTTVSKTFYKVMSVDRMMKISTEKVEKSSVFSPLQIKPFSP